MGTEATLHRTPRAYPERVPTGEVVLAAPPSAAPDNQGGLMQVLFPVVGSFGMLGFALAYHNKTFLYVAGGMVVLSVGFAVAMRISQVRGTRRRLRKQRKRYRSYLAEKERELARIRDLQESAAERLYPDPSKLWSLVVQRRGVWERRLGDSDFLDVRLGRGAVPLEAPPRLDVGDNPLAEFDSDLLYEARRLVERTETVRGLPVVASLAGHGIVSVVGDDERVRPLLRSLFCQLAAWRAPADMRLAAVFTEERREQWEWLKWLPHTRGGETVARSEQELVALLEAEVGPRLEHWRRMSEAGPDAPMLALQGPKLVVVVDDFSPSCFAMGIPLFREALERASDLGLVFLLVAGSRELEPSDIDARIDVPARAPLTFESHGPDGERRSDVWPDAMDVGSAEAIARSLTPLKLEERGGGSADLSQDVRLLNLLGLRSAADLNPVESWRPKPRVEQLRVPLGIDENGEPVVLDLKESADGGMGPHGLIVGATGSGKSELLRTLVAGLAMRHSPDELGFVLVDYKGGAAFAELARLPHTAGLITNLESDEALIDRMHEALVGEQERRQSLLREAGNLDDIKAYREKRERDPSLEPLPYLLVIVDEFGELLASRPEFIDLFVAIGRVGRSLGIHLLFSSQRLDEGRLRGLESHLRYRICLRTYSSVDSKVVLGTPDAYLLPPIPGMAYLKVDVSLYQRFKAALVSSPEEAPELERERPPEARPFEPLGPRPVVRGPRERAGGPAQMELVVGRLQGAHAGSVHQVWLPPLDPVEPLDKVIAGRAWWEHGGDREQLRVPLGTLDLPAEQRQQPLEIGFAGSAGHLGIVGAPRTGKSTLLRTLIASFAWTHTPDEAQFYCVDLGGGLLRALEESPNVGGVAGKLEREKVRRIVAQLRATIEEREVLFRRQAIDSIADVRARRSRGELPPEWSELADVFLVIDGWGSFRREFEGLDQSVEEIAASGLGYGVHVVLSAGRWAEMRQSLRDSIGSRLELRLHDPLESEVGKAAAKSLPADVPGRGLTPSGEHFQIALPRVDGVAEPDGSGDALARLLAEPASRWKGAAAPPVRMLPLRITVEELEARRLDPQPGVLAAVEELRLDPVWLDLAGGDPHFLVLGDSESGKTNFLRLFLRGLTERFPPEEAQVLVVDFRRTLLDAAEGPHLFDYAATAQMVTDAVARLSAALGERLPSATASREELLRGPDWSGPRYYLVVDDYDLLVSPAGSPLAGLSELLPQGKDIGLHLVLARRVGGMSRAAFEPVIQRLRELSSPGLVMSGDPQEGPVIGAQRAAPQPPGRGYLVRRHERTTLVQTLIAEERRGASHTAVRGRAQGRMSSREVHL